MLIGSLEVLLLSREDSIEYWLNTNNLNWQVEKWYKKQLQSQRPSDDTTITILKCGNEIENRQKFRCAPCLLLGHQCLPLKKILSAKK
jgi:hypothetical protein